MDWSTIAALAQAFTAVVALAIAVAAIILPARQQRKREQAEIDAVRLALHTEVAMIGKQCLEEYRAWTAALESGAGKDVRTAMLPPLTIYNAIASSIGRLTRDEIVSLIGFSSTLADISTVAARIDRDRKGVPPVPDDKKALVVLFSHACRLAAECMRALPVPGADLDRTFINELDEAGNHGRQERERLLGAAAINRQT